MLAEFSGAAAPRQEFATLDAIGKRSRSRARELPGIALA